MIEKVKNKKKSEIMLELLKVKNRTKKEWKEESMKQGMSDKTFYYHFNNFIENGLIRYIAYEKKWIFVVPRDKPDHKEIKLYIEHIRNKNKKIRELCAHELINLCKTKVVENDSFLMRFFEIAFKDNLFIDIRFKLFEAFRNILFRNLKDNNLDIIEKLLERNKDSIIRFISSGELKLKSNAINTLRFCPGRDVLSVLYEKIIISDKNDYHYLKNDILECLKSHLKDYEVELKRKLYGIATIENYAEEVRERAIDLLYELSGLGEKILA